MIWFELLASAYHPGGQVLWQFKTDSKHRTQSCGTDCIDVALSCLHKGRLTFNVGLSGQICCVSTVH